MSCVVKDIVAIARHCIYQCDASIDIHFRKQMNADRERWRRGGEMLYYDWIV